MRLSLFWKILGAFWITIILIAQGMWFLFGLIGPFPSSALFVARRAGEVTMAATVSLLHDHPRADLDTLQAAWPLVDRQRLHIVAVPTTTALAPVNEVENAGRYSAVVEDRDGRRFRIEYRPNGLSRKPPAPERHIPVQLLIVGALGGLAFSAALAWYLTRPVMRLRAGFERFARGDLSTRLTDQMGGRRDELADLATDFDRMAERLQALVASRDQLLHDVSHELRSPLARIQLAIALAQPHDISTTDALLRVEQEVRRIDELVGNLIALARLEGEPSNAEDYVDLAALTDAIAADARFEAGSSITLVIDIAPPSQTSSYHVKGNVELLRRAIENVVRNGVRYSPNAGTLRIILSEDDRDVRIETQDDGPGVSEALLPFIFEPFRHGPSSIGKTHGLGLGLAIAQRAVVAHHGSITASNRREGGLNVTIVLPRTDAIFDDHCTALMAEGDSIVAGLSEPGQRQPVNEIGLN